MASPLLCALLLAAAPDLGPALADREPVHLGIVLRLEDPAGLAALLADQQDATSAGFHRFLTPEQFGARFGVSEARYAAMVELLAARGFKVERYPNRLFLEATGTVGGVRELLGVQLRSVVERGRPARTYEGELALPAEFAGRVLSISGLDTRLHLKHRINVAGGGQALGADDLRIQYNLGPFFAAGHHAAAGLTTAVLGTQEGTGSRSTAPFIAPSVTAIQTYFNTISHASAAYQPIVLPNSNADFDTEGSNQEYQLDVEMQSVGAADAASINLVLAPSSEVFTTGAQYIVNQLASASAVSTSIGDCEYEEATFNGGPTQPGSEMQALQQALQQGIAEGQTWFAAAGDQGSDDCEDNNSTRGRGFGGGNATVDFPASMPEFVALGGTQFSGNASWDSSGSLTAVVPEATWNEGNQNGGGGGGQSLYYAKPGWQQGIGPNASDSARDLPDLSLNSAVDNPGTAVYDCGDGQDSSCQGETTGAGALDVFGGTSVAAPLAAGIFALVAGETGCALGDVHPALYVLGAAQQGGGARVFHDITSGENGLDGIAGFSAGAGYDLATGWGALDVAALVAAWPACGSSGSSSGSTGSLTSSSGGASTTGGAAGTSAGASTSSGASAGSGSAASSTTGSGGGAGTTGASVSAESGGSTGTTPTTGCSCGARPGPAGFGGAALLALFALRRRRR